jgi:phage terminase large subunit-like protein
MYIATTPRPTSVIKSLCNNPYVEVIKGTTMDNYFLTPKYAESLKRELTDRMFRQECLAEILDDNPYALWRMTDIESCRIHDIPELRRIVVGVDPAVTSSDESDETGIVVCGVDYGNRVYVLEDCSVSAATPEQWASVVVDAYKRWSADSVVAEVNQGGDMVESIILQKSRSLRVIKVRATKGKAVRAEPVAALYERHECHHVGRHDRLEQQMTEWDPVNSKKSPDRMDPLVWAVTELADLSASQPMLFMPSRYR